MTLFTRVNPSYLDDVFDNFFAPVKSDSVSKMKCDIYEKDGIYTMEMDIPGFSREDVNIEIDDNDYLTIIAEKTIENNDNDDNKNYVRRERSYGKYQRSFYIGDVDKDNIDAVFENGILKVTMPKKQEQQKQKKTIEIK